MSYESGRRGNQTAAHSDLTDRASTWAANRSTLSGIRWTTERSCGFYSPDLVVMGAFSGSDMLARYGLPDYDRRVWVFESKVSRTDFVRHFGRVAKDKSRCTPLGDFHWVVMPGTMEVPENEMPEWWGILRASGGGLRETRTPKYTERTAEQRNEIAAAILWARDTYERDQDRARQIAKHRRSNAKWNIQVLAFNVLHDLAIT